jgi:hypothetical protein
MNRTIGVFAALLFVTTVALGQQYQPLPFPQAANPALANRTIEKTSPSLNVNVPSSMAPHTPTEAIATSRDQPNETNAPLRHQFDSRSPFPCAANLRNW